MTSFGGRSRWDELIGGDRRLRGEPVEIPEPKGGSGSPSLHDQQERPDFSPRLAIEVVTVGGRAAQVEFMVRRDTVEVWHRERCQAVMGRDELRAWLADPAFGPLVVDDLRLTFDRAVDELGRVAITLPDVSAWTLSPIEQADLLDRVS